MDLQKFDMSTILKTKNIFSNIGEVYERYNATDEKIKTNTLNSIFSEKASIVPDNIAVIDGENRITYRELDEKSNMVANYLIGKGIKKSELIGVYAPRKVSTIINVLGVLKAGCAYVPIDMEYPKDRVDYIIANSKCRIVLEEQTFDNEIINCSHEKPEIENNEESLAYVIYTSGSTGLPKGVQITHRAAANTILDINRKFGVDENDRIIALSSLCFDLSVYDIFGSLFAGAAIVEVSDQRDIRSVMEILCKEGITIWNSIPSTMNMLVDNIKESETTESLRLVLLSGDWIPLNLPKKIHNHFSNANIISLGGATEASIWSIYYPIDKIHNDWRSIPYGMPLANQKMYILNFEQELCPEGVEGEIYIGGLGIAQGYYNDIKKTEEVFIVHKSLGRLYRTGDYGILNKDGYIEFVGRKDNQVKIRGYRIELGEVESAITACEEIDGAVVTVKKDSRGDYLCCYYVMNHYGTIDNVKDKIGNKLPPYMMPSKFIKLDKLPLTPNGKIDRKGLPEIEISQEISDNVAEISDEIQEKLLEIFHEVFGNSMQIGVRNNFFELGVDSIIMVNIITKIEDKFNVQIKFKEFLKQNNIVELANLIRTSVGAVQNESYRQKDSVDENLHEPFPISDVQMAYLMGRDSAFELGGVSTHAYGEIESNLEIRRFNISLQKVIDRHPVLRSIILPNGTQKILEGRKEYKMEVLDYSEEDDENFNRRVLEERNRLSHHVFKTDEWPLFNFKAFKTPRNTYYIFIEYDLLIGDGMSVRILVDELYKYYINQEAELEPIRYNFKDYMLAKQDFKISKAYLSAQKYWMDKIETFPSAPALIYKKNPSQIQNPHYARIGKKLDEAILTQLRSMARKHSVTLSALLCTAFSQVLAHWSNQPHHAINLTVFNRYPFHPDVDKIIGDFTSTMLIDIDLSSNTDFWSNCINVQGVLMEALENRYYNGIEFTREIAKYSHMENRAIMPIVFTSMIFEDKKKLVDSTDKLGKTIYEASQTSQVFLDYQVSDDNGELKMSWDYVTELFDKNMIEDMFDAYINLLNSIAAKSDGFFIPNFNSEDTLAFVKKFNTTNIEIEKHLLYEMLYQQAKKNPQKIAVKCGDEWLSYAQLNHKSNQIAHYLREKGISRNDFVAVLGERHPHSITNIMGILKAGAAYVPIDPNWPSNRIDFIMSACNAKYFLGEKYDFDLNAYSLDDVSIINEPDDIAYVIFTSGSTGTPKGVKITHASVYNTIYDINKRFCVNEADKILGVSSMNFDLSVYDIFGAQLAGAMLIQIEDPKDINGLIKTIFDEKITIYNSVPAIMELITDNLEIEEISDELKLVLLSGDWIGLNLPNKIKSHFPSAVSVSLGGATEASIWSIFHVIDKVEPEWTSIPYGKPLSNQAFYVLNYNMELCPIGVQGELYIGGDGVAAGYLSDDVNANEAFIVHEKLGRIYRTGDYGVLLNKGYIKFLGRKDSQVKIGGYRIELGEIEKNLLLIPSVQNTIVIDFSDEKGKYLCAYIVSDDEIDIEYLKKFLLKKLPDYMIPAIFMRIQQLPLSVNGKVNKKLLPFPQRNSVTKSEVKFPRDQMGKELFKIWKEILNVDTLGTNDNFYSLGGHSILMISIIAKIEKQLHVKISYKEFIDNCTIEQLSDLITVKKRNNPFTYPTAEINKDDFYKPFPLTQVQMAYLIGRDHSFDLGGVSTHMYTELVTELDMEKLNESLQKIIERHPMLRAIVKKSGEQVILEKVPVYTIKIENISNLDENKQQMMIHEKRKRLSAHVFETDKWPLFNFEAYRLSDKHCYLFVEFDQLITDGMSIQIITKDLIDFYNNPDMPVKNTEFTFRDYMIACDKLRNSEKYQEDKEYWMAKIDEFPASPTLPIKQIRGGTNKFTFKRLTKVFPKKDWEQLKEIAKRNMVSPSALICAIYAKVLGTWSNQKHLALNLTVFNRYPVHQDVNKIVGDFTSVLLLDIDTGISKNFIELAKGVQNELLNALEHRHFDGIEVIRQIAKRDNVVNKPVMPVVFTSMLFGDSDKVDSVQYGVIGEQKYMATQTSQVYLDHQVNDAGNELTLTWDYISELFDEETISGMFSQYITWMAEIIKGNVEFLEYISNDDYERIKSYNKTYVNFSFHTLPQLFKNTVERVPDSIAVIDGEQMYSYGEIDRLSNKVANYLSKKGIGIGDRVTVLCPRHIETIYAILGIMKVGAAYIPVEVGYPQDRIDYIIKNSGSDLLIDSFKISEVVKNYSDIFTGRVNDDVESLAYIIYTSGSTGEPKGVMISHKAAANTILDINTKFNVTEKDRIAGISSMCFDLSVYDIFGAFSSGAAFVMIPNQRDVKEILDIVKKNGITIWNSVPAIMNMAVEFLKSRNVNRYEWDEPDLDEDVMEKTYFWSPVALWKIDGQNVYIKDEKYNDRIFSELMPELYFFTQGGVTLEQLYNKFGDEKIDELKEDIDMLIKDKVLISGILKPEELFASQEKLLRHNYGTDLLFKKEAYERFKQMQMCRELSYEKTEVVRLEENFTMPDTLTNRESCREFDEKNLIPFSTFSMLFSAFKQKNNNGKITYYYASAGGLYPIDVFVYVKENRVEDVAKGLYYYNPINNQLVLVNGHDAITVDAHYFTNKPIFKSSAFSVFFIYNAPVTMPRYGGAGYLYSFIDTGIMVSTLDQICEELNIGHCSIGDMNFEKIESLFKLKENQVHIHTVECGIKVGNKSVVAPTRQIEQNTGNFNSLRLVLLSGDWISLDLPGKVQSCFSNANVISLGGATEASIWSIYYMVDKVDSDWKSIPYGFPLANQQIYILNEDGNLAPINAMGEICIGGAGVSDGYVNDEIRNRNSFVESKRFGRLYKTGDYGILHRDGYVEFMGRKDSQVKINGFRVELGEVEAKMQKIEGITQCVSILQSEGGNHFIVAYYVANKPVSKDKLRMNLKESLPDYMIPKYFIQIDKVRLTDNGKIDRKRLPVFRSTENQQAEYILPKTGLEKFICDMVARTLEVERVGLESDFFEMNGDSLKATIFISELQRELGVNIGYEIFSNSKISDMIEFIVKDKPEIIKMFNKKKESIILLRIGSERGKNLFLFGDIRGEVEQYKPMCDVIDESYTCYGVRTVPNDGLTAEDATVEELVNPLVSEIVKIQGDGVYRLAGWSFGGLLAFDAARQLSQAKNVKFVGIIDSLQPGHDIDEKFDFSFKSEKDLVAQYISKEIAEDEYIMDSKSLWQAVINYFEHDLKAFESFKNAFGELSFLIQSDIPMETIKKFNIFRTLSNAQSKYSPNGQIATFGYLFRAEKSFINMNQDEWSKYFENVKKYSLDSDHVGAIQGNNAEIISHAFDQK